MKHLMKVFKSKIHRATITGADLNYEGSIEIDSDLLEMANMSEYEAVWIWNVNNGERLMTYIIKGPKGSGVIGLNGAAARLGQKGDVIIITTFADIDSNLIEFWKPTVVLVDEHNKMKFIASKSGGLSG
jgi:aspartate 1-decarboxylase